MTAIWVFECASGSRAPCIMFQVGNLAAPVPRPQSASAESGVVAGTDRKASGDAVVKAKPEKREIVKEHTFRTDGGNVTLVSEYV
jgi:hypothetical protein